MSEIHTTTERAEAEVLGALIVYPEFIAEAAESLSPESFANPKHRAIFGAILTAGLSGGPTGMLEIVDAAKPGTVTASDLVALASRVTSSAHILHYTALVAGHARLRGLAKFGRELAEEAPTDTTLPSAIEAYIEEVSGKLFSLVSKGEAARASVLPCVLAEVFRDMEAARAAKGLTGLRTGVYKLDDSMSLFQPGRLVILGARPGMGKSALAVQMGMYAATHEGHHIEGRARVMVFSLEMSKAQLGVRILSGAAGIDSRRIETAKVSDPENDRLDATRADLGQANVLIDDTPGISIHSIRARARRAKLDQGLDLVIVDYIQLVHGDTRYRERHLEVGSVARALKEMAAELGIPVLALAQVGRGLESREDRMPRLSDLRESGDMEQDADSVVFLDRPGMHDDRHPLSAVNVCVAKNRSGPTGTFELLFDAPTTTFRNKAPNYDEAASIASAIY